MKKKVLILVLGLLLVGVNLYAADGDFIVEGNVGIGADTPTAKLDVDSTNSVAGDFYATRTSDQFLGAMKLNYIDNFDGATTGGQGLWVQATHGTGASFSNYDSTIRGAVYLVRLQGSNTINTYGVTVQNNSLLFISAGNYSFDNVIANSSGINTAGADSGIRTITNLTAYQGSMNLGNGSGTWNVENASIFYAPAMSHNANGTINNTSGLIVEKQSIGTNNMGIWLKDDGIGADIVFGAGQETKLYGNSGNLIIDTSGKVGIGTTSPQATLDVAGYAKLQPYSQEPSQCNAGQNGSIALTSNYMICACNGSSWVKTTDGAACSW